MKESRDRILVVEDDLSLAELLVEELEAENFAVTHARSAEDALARIPTLDPSLVVSDLRLPGADGMVLLRHCRQRHIPPAFLIITAFGTINQAVEALKAGADEFLTKPLLIDHFLLTARRLLENRQIRHEVQHYRSLYAEEVFHGILGQSEAMRVLFGQIRQIASADGPVLIQGESGTGKELVARAVHRESDRRDGPFMAVNCAGVPGELIESEFFGHVSGAFTGASQTRDGLFTQADGGILLLDEIAEMPYPLQAKLLRVLQDGRIRPVGSDKEMQVNTRIIAVSNRDLPSLCQRGEFREDLYYRLETFALTVPPLRDREGDIELLADHFLQLVRQKKERRITGFTSEALARLRGYRFPGNVRELQNAIERAVAFCDRDVIAVEHLPQRIVDNARADPGAGAEWHSLLPVATGGELPKLATLQRDYVQHVLSRTEGNKRKAAEILGVTRRTLYRWLEQG